MVSAAREATTATKPRYAGDLYLPVEAIRSRFDRWDASNQIDDIQGLFDDDTPTENNGVLGEKNTDSRTIERGLVPRRLSETNVVIIIIFSLQKQQVIHEG